MAHPAINDIRSVVDVPLMPEAHDQHHKLLVFNPAQEAVVLNTVAPELTEIPFEIFAELPGIIATRHAGIEERKDPPGRLMAELAKLLESLRGNSIIPAHVLLRRRNNCGQGCVQRRQPNSNPQGRQGAAQ